MSLIEWGEELEIGLPSVDGQHEKLVSIINTLNDALEIGSANRVLSSVFDDLCDYTQFHFAYEEKLFKQYHYKETEKHIQEHQELIANIRVLKRKMREGDFMVSVETMSFLKDWLSVHILQSDKAFVPYLLEKGAN